MNVGSLIGPFIHAILDELQKGKGVEPQGPNSTACALASNTYFVVQLLDKVRASNSKEVITGFAIGYEY